jgi:DNA-directed RNA polymerase specialized sigma24 family protein
LSPFKRRLLVDTYIFGHSSTEIGQLHQMHPITARTQTLRAKRELQRVISQTY